MRIESVLAGAVAVVVAAASAWGLVFPRLYPGGMWTYYAARFAPSGAAPEESLLVQIPEGIHLSYAADLVLLVPAYLLAAVLLWRLTPWGCLLEGTLLFSGVRQQAGYAAELAAQSRAGIPGAAGSDPNEPPIVVACLAGSVALLAAAPSIRPRTGLNDAALG